ncbi:MAG TPA: hypothetical protein VNS33_16165 [Bradyrhizobium sp.]|nr:hypothetical protein [Bradyrhizobium sp.]
MRDNRVLRGRHLWGGVVRMFVIEQSMSAINFIIYRLADPHPRIGVLLLLSIAINWLAALAYGRTKMPAILTAAIVADLAVLSVFKYARHLRQVGARGALRGAL